MNFSRKCCPGMKWLAVGAVFCVAFDIAKVEGDLVHKLDGFPHGGVMLLLKGEWTVITSALFESL